MIFIYYVALETPPSLLSCRGELSKKDDFHNRHSSPPRRNGGDVAELILLSLEDL